MVFAVHTQLEWLRHHYDLYLFPQTGKIIEPEILARCPLRAKSTTDRLHIVSVERVDEVEWRTGEGSGKEVYDRG